LAGAARRPAEPDLDLAAIRARASAGAADADALSANARAAPKRWREGQDKRRSAEANGSPLHP
jgi:conjugal transfer pilus assembly protein TrbC